MIRLKLAKAALFILLALQAALSEAGLAAESFVWIESWRHPTPMPIERAAAGDVDGDGVPEIAVLSGGTVTVYSLGPDRPRAIGSIRSPSGRYTAVAMADFDGDGASEVWTGTAAPGIVQIHRFDGREFRLAYELRYAWEDVHILLPLDLDGWGMTDLALVTSGGLLHVYRWNGTALERHDLGGLQRGVRFAAAGDIDSDGADEVVVARGQDHVVVLEWRDADVVHDAEVSVDPEARANPDGDAAARGAAGSAGEVSTVHAGAVPAFPAPRGGELAVRWENFVWGGHTHLAVGDFMRGLGEEVFLSTSRGLVYVFDSGTGGAVGQPAPENRLVLAEQAIGTGDLDVDGTEELLLKVETGIEAWDVSPFRRSMLLVTPAQPVEFVHIIPEEGVMAVAGPWGLARFDRKDGRYVRVIRNGAVFPLAKEALVTPDSIYLSASDWEALIGMRLRFDSSSGRVTGIRGFHFLVGDIKSGDWIYDGRPLQIAHSPVVENGELYLPIDFAGAVGVPADWDPFSRTLFIRR